MMETNRPKVLTAAATVVVLADMAVEAAQTSELIKRAAPQMGAYADMIPTLLPIFAGSEGKNTVAEWAFKNAGLVGMRLLDAATAHGLATAIVSACAAPTWRSCREREREGEGEAWTPA